MTTATFTPDREAFRQMLATLAAKTKTKIPALNGRVEKAVRLALAGDVELHDDGTATVYSSSDPTRRYEIREGACTCRDYELAPEHLCQHRLSAGLVRRTYELLPQEIPVEAYPDNDPEGDPEPPAPGLSLPEAPASVNVHLTLGGRDVLWTLRDTDETRLAGRLASLLARYPLETQMRASSPPADQAPLCQYHGTMKASAKAPGTWYCPSKMGDGSYCKERYPA